MTPITPMTPERHQRVQDLFIEARACERAKRDLFLEVACSGDAALRAEVDSLLAYDGTETAPVAPRPAPAGAGIIGHQIGRYRLKDVIAAGGMGTVYEAMQEHPRRVVALKVMRAGIASRAALRRFEYESQILARLRHPGIAQIYEAGTHEEPGGRVPYFAMEYIPGARDITAFADREKLATRDRLRLFASVCDAVHHGHLKGIVHRDLKPANILVDSSGQPKIIDFGVARSTDSDLTVTTLQTEIGQLVGTVQYMSPEQCQADPHDIDARSDVYSLGVVLYELLCGRPPYPLAGESILRATHMIAQVEPCRPSSVDRTLRGDAETIVLKALEKKRERRYQSAAELAADIRRYLANQPIEARPPSVAYQFSMFARRNRSVCAAVAAAFAVLLGALIVISVMAARERAAAARERAAATRLTSTISSVRRYMWDGLERFRSSANLLAALEQDERPGFPGRTVALVSRPQQGAGDRALAFVDHAGTELLALDRDIRVPAWADDAGFGVRRFEIKGALLEDVRPSNPGREVLVILNDAASQCGLLRVYDLELNLLAEMWNSGCMLSVHWDARHKLIIGTCYGRFLPFYVPSLAPYDSAACPEMLDRPVIAFAVRPENIAGVMIPLVDGAGPAATLEWALFHPDIALPGPSRPWIAQMHSADPPDENRADAAARLYVNLVHRYYPDGKTLRGNLFGWAHIGPDGALLEPFTHEAEPHPDEPPQITQNIRHLNVGAVVSGRALAEPAASSAGTLDECVSALRQQGLGEAKLEAATDAASAMYNNWRWLLRAAKATPSPPSTTPAQLDRARALARRAVEIHQQRCPRPDTCKPGWYAANALVAVQFRSGEYEEVLRTLAVSEPIWAALPGQAGQAHPADAAYRAGSLLRLGKAAEAHAEWARARALLENHHLGSDDDGRAAREALSEVQPLFGAPRP